MVGEEAEAITMVGGIAAIEKEFRPPLWRPFFSVSVQPWFRSLLREYLVSGCSKKAPRPRLLFGERHREHSMLTPRGSE